ncbi:MAG: GatB/YqeY domain-containing protein [Flavobacteriales bacterium]|nr:GatB/YqeY domain-containing protein [Flavobacteriales bacterium]MBP9079402.1 GatB/YqeY domain-containing protein [Flavobacteriales bacterium]
MDLQHRIDTDIKAAMLAREKDRLNVLRAIKSALLLELTKEGGTHELGEETGLRILQKLHKQRTEAAAIYHQQGRADLAAEDDAQAKIIEGYLPARMGEAEVQAAVKATLTEIGANTMADMGKAMKAVNAKLAGKADGSVIAAAVKKLLSGG